jgi:putative toxin-antitoxin system antitoxin component (TIGR02293 family)
MFIQAEAKRVPVKPNLPITALYQAALGRPTLHDNAHKAYKAAVNTLFYMPSEGVVVMRDESANVIARHGVEVGALKALQATLDMPALESYQLIAIDKSHFSRLQAAGRPLNEAQSAKMLRAMELTALANEVFASQADASTWLKRAHPLFNGESPLDYAVSEFGASKVRDCLVSLKYGGVV